MVTFCITFKFQFKKWDHSQIMNRFPNEHQLWISPKEIRILILVLTLVWIIHLKPMHSFQAQTSQSKLTLNVNRTKRLIRKQAGHLLAPWKCYDWVLSSGHKSYMLIKFRTPVTSYNCWQTHFLWAALTAILHLEIEFGDDKILLYIFGCWAVRRRMVFSSRNDIHL